MGQELLYYITTAIIPMGVSVITSLTAVITAITIFKNSIKKLLPEKKENEAELKRLRKELAEERAESRRLKRILYRIHETGVEKDGESK